MPNAETDVLVFTNRKTIREKFAMQRHDTPTGGHTLTRVPDGREEVTYDVFLHAGSLDQMACKAAGNKSGRSRDGAVMVIVRNRSRL